MSLVTTSKGGSSNGEESPGGIGSSSLRSVWSPLAGLRSFAHRSADRAYESIEIDAHRSVDVDEAGNVIGFEVLGIANYAVDDIAERFGLTELVPEINHAATVALQTRVVIQERVLSGIPAGETPLPSAVAEPPRAVVLAR